MKNKNVGFLISGIAVVVFIMIFVFNYGLKKIVGQTCSHGVSCTMYDTIAIQTWVSFIIRRVKEKVRKKKLDLSGLEKDEKEVINFIQSEGGAVFQSTMMEKFGFGKVKTTRLLDKLEAKQFIERKRRGMNNIVVLKQ